MPPTALHDAVDGLPSLESELQDILLKAVTALTTLQAVSRRLSQGMPAAFWCLAPGAKSHTMYEVEEDPTAETTFSVVPGCCPICMRCIRAGI